MDCFRTMFSFVAGFGLATTVTAADIDVSQGRLQVFKDAGGEVTLSVAEGLTAITSDSPIVTLRCRMAQWH